MTVFLESFLGQFLFTHSFLLQKPTEGKIPKEIFSLKMSSLGFEVDSYAFESQQITFKTTVTSILKRDMWTNIRRTLL